jgi:copper chaperone CopZ
MNHRIFHVPDVSCSHCVAAIEGEVGDVAGVAQVTVDLGRKTVAVDGEFEEADVVAAIADAGYEVAPQ